MLRELAATSDGFGIMPRLSWDGLVEIPAEVRRAKPDLYAERLHPCCALVKNTTVFRSVVRDVGLPCLRYRWANDEEYPDMFKLKTRVIGTHGLRHLVSDPIVLHKLLRLVRLGCRESEAG
jgi:hypothetical protein